MNAVSNIYLIIFLPLISSLLCQLFSKRFLPFVIALSSCILLFFLTLNILPDVLTYEKISNDFELSPLSITLEFKVDVLSIIFLLLIIFLKIVILFYYRSDIEKYLDKKNSKIFYSVYLLHMFALVGIFTTNNLLNLFLFFEIYSFTFFANLSISKDLKISKISFKYFCLNASSSLLILFCFLAIYMSLGEVNLDRIAENLLLIKGTNEWFLISIFLLLTIAFFVKFFPFWLYFENLKNTNLIADFLAIDSIFIKTNIGIYVVLKFLYFFFDDSGGLIAKLKFAPILIFFSLILIFYSAIKLYQQKHLKLISTYSCLNNLGFIFVCLALQTTESFQAAFFYILNFSLVNFLIFLFATFIKRYFKTSSISKIWLIRKNHFLLVLPIKLLIFSIAAFPLTLLFFANWYLAYASFKIGFEALILVALVASSFVNISLATKLIFSFTARNNSEEKMPILGLKKYQFYLMSFWFLTIMIYFLSLNFSLTNNMSLRFASYLLSNIF